MSCRYGNDAKVIHFIGAVKPWHLTFDTSTQSVDLSGVSPDSSHSLELLNMWWRTFMSAVRPNLDMSTVSNLSPLSGLSPAFFWCGNSMLNDRPLDSRPK